MDFKIGLPGFQGSARNLYDRNHMSINFRIKVPTQIPTKNSTIVKAILNLKIQKKLK